jgi:hypothetical protein
MPEGVASAQPIKRRRHRLAVSNADESREEVECAVDSREECIELPIDDHRVTAPDAEPPGCGTFYDRSFLKLRS